MDDFSIARLRGRARVGSLACTVATGGFWFECGVHDFVDVFDEREFQRLLHFCRHVGEILFVQLGNNDLLDSGAYRGERLFLQAICPNRSCRIFR